MADCSWSISFCYSRLIARGRGRSTRSLYVEEFKTGILLQELAVILISLNFRCMTVSLSVRCLGIKIRKELEGEYLYRGKRDSLRVGSVHFWRAFHLHCRKAWIKSLALRRAVVCPIFFTLLRFQKVEVSLKQLQWFLQGSVGFCEVQKPFGWCWIINPGSYESAVYEKFVCISFQGGVTSGFFFLSNFIFEFLILKNA